jgi:hypothetical protein
MQFPSWQPPTAADSHEQELVVSSAGLFQDEVEGKPFSYAARDFLDAIRNGATQKQALKHAGVSGARLVIWKQKERFRDELKAAERREGVAKYTSFEQIGAPQDPNALPPWSSLAEIEHQRRLGPDSGVPGTGGPEYGYGSRR